MDGNATLTLEQECERDKDCLFVAGDGLFRVWHVILIAAAIAVIILVVLLRFLKCPRLPEEARKRKELEIKRQESGENETNLELNSTDGHVTHVTSPYEGNVDQPLDPPGNVDMPLTPPQAHDINVTYNPSTGHKSSTTRYSRYSHEPSDSVELRYVRSRTTSEVRDSYYQENSVHVDTSMYHHPQVNGNTTSQFPPIMSTSTRI